jgi:UPF0716 protein FxsA
MMPRQASLVGVGLVLTAIAEIVVFVLVAHWLGVAVTILLVLATSLLGAWLLRGAGIRAWRGLRAAAASGRPPGPELGAGVLGLVGALLLVLPGFLTDLVGLGLLAPPVRRLAGLGAQRLAERRLSSAAAGTLFGPRRVRVRRGRAYQPAPGPTGRADTDTPIEGEIVER